ncbi:MAG: universal stress protein [Hyphomicrobiaceae bacterium]|nr:universal stress protein [Hyphomicrobiaceae bacterium]
MAIKDLLVAYDGNEASQHALEFALQMGNKYKATVTGMAVSRPEPFESHLRKWIPDNVKESMHTARLEATKSIEAKFREQVKGTGHTGEVQWLVEEGQPDLTLARSARFFDILIIGQFLTAFKTEHRSVDPQELLQRAGKPILIVPKHYKPRPFREEAAVAWDGSRHAARALTDAMQILETKKKLYILEAHAEKQSRDIGDLPGLDLQVHLKRHGVESEIVKFDSTTHGVGPALLQHCEEIDPDVLVMGAYGRAKFGAQFFGGVTRYVLQNHKVPVLLSH